MRKEIVLASASPRRQELMRDTGLTFIIHPAKGEETIKKNLSPEKAIEQLAKQKAEEVFAYHPQSIVIGCDTMVVLGEEMLGKPKDPTDARRMLNAMSNTTHRVITGVAIRSKDEERIFHETTYVSFYELDEALLERYIASDEPYDKAGAYGIQGKGKLLVKKIDGDYFNVMGLPVARLYRELMRFL